VSTELDPVLGNWYRHLDKGQLFSVISVDEESNVIEIQHFDGDVEEVALTEWKEMDLELAEAPEDWSGPVDDVERDDTGYSETDMSADDWAEPLADTPRDRRERWEDTAPEDESNGSGEGRTFEEERSPGLLENSKDFATGSGEDEER
jgi:hypothetical protein